MRLLGIAPCFAQILAINIQNTFWQVNRASGAFMMSQRRNSMHVPATQMLPALSGSGHLPSGVLDTFSSLASDENRDAGVEVELAEDEEFAAEEHAHRCRALCCKTTTCTKGVRCCMFAYNPALCSCVVTCCTLSGSGSKSQAIPQTNQLDNLVLTDAS